MSSSSPKSRRPLVLVACMAVMFMTAVEATIVSTAMPTVAAALGGYALFSWTFAAYLLTQATAIPIYGRLADLHGRKPIFLAGAAIFIVGCAVCGAAPSMLVLIIGRAVQGLGAGGIMPIAQTIIGDLYSPAERARIQGWLASMWAISAMIGPLMGAFIVQHLSWPVTFWFNIPLALAVMLLFVLLLREDHKRADHSIDVIGAILMIIAVGGLMLCLLQANHLGTLLVPILIVSAVAFVLLVLQEARAPEPLLPIMLFRDPIMKVCNIGSFLLGAASMGVSVFLPTYIQGVMGRDAYTSGATLAFMMLGWPIGATLAGRLMLRTSYRATALGGGVLTVAAGVMLAVIHPSLGQVWAASATFFIGLGLGLINSPFMVVVQDVSARHVRGMATAANTFNRLLGSAVGTAVLGAALNFTLARLLPGFADPVQSLVDPIERAALTPDVLAHMTGAVLEALHVAFWTATVLALMALATAWFLPRGMKPGERSRGEVAAGEVPPAAAA